LLDEVERVADHLALINAGRVVLGGPTAEVTQGHRWVTYRFAEPRATPPAVAGVLAWEGGGCEWTALCGGAGAGDAAAAGCGARVVSERPPTLEEIFVARVAPRGAAVGEV